VFIGVPAACACFLKTPETGATIGETAKPVPIFADFSKNFLRVIFFSFILEPPFFSVAGLLLCRHVRILIKNFILFVNNKIKYNLIEFLFTHIE